MNPKESENGLSFFPLLVKKRKIHFRILSDFKSQSWIFLIKKRTLISYLALVLDMLLSPVPMIAKYLSVHHRKLYFTHQAHCHIIITSPFRPRVPTRVLMLTVPCFGESSCLRAPHPRVLRLKVPLSWVSRPPSPRGVHFIDHGVTRRPRFKHPTSQSPSHF